jgi:hypothetical protein
MRSGFPFLVASALVLLAAPGLSGDALAGKPMAGSKSSIAPTEANDPIAPLATVLSTSFETFESFVVAPLEPQNGWTASGTNAPWASVSALSPAVGAQHVRMVKDPAAGQGVSRIIFSPLAAVAPNSPSQVKMLIDLSNDGGSDYDFFGQAPSQGFITWRVKFSFADAGGAGPGTIFILDDLGIGPEFVDTGVIWTENAYQELKVQFDPAAGEIRYFYGGVQIYTGVIYAGTSVEQIGALNDNYQLAGETADVDAVVWIDTPSDPVPVRNASWGRIKGQYR